MTGKTLADDFAETLTSLLENIEDPAEREAIENELVSAFLAEANKIISRLEKKCGEFSSKLANLEKKLDKI